MNYDHRYHAGALADIFKHLVLIALIEKLKQKDKAFAYIDTHTGFPYYEIKSAQALQTKEAQQGIGKLFQTKNQPTAIQFYLQLIVQFNEALQAKSQQYYPGSSNFVHLLKRPQDQMILNELANAPYVALKDFFKRDKTVHCHKQDAYTILKALVPPKEKRGLVLIDPPFEDPFEFEHIHQALEVALTRWPQGVYAIWYPIKDQRATEKFVQKINQAFDLPQQNFVHSALPSDVGQRLSGSGMLLINPPWQIETIINPLLAWLNNM